MLYIINLSDFDQHRTYVGYFLRRNAIYSSFLIAFILLIAFFFKSLGGSSKALWLSVCPGACLPVDNF